MTIGCLTLKLPLNHAKGITFPLQIPGPMSTPHFLGTLLGLIGFALVLHAADSSGDGGVSVQDLLRANGLPPGLLPSAVKSYNFDQETGILEVHLNSPCLAKYDGLVFFNQTVRGNLSYGSLRGVVGFSQEELFLWLPVKEILVTDPSSGVIYFDIGVARKQLSLSLFENPPDCSAGEEDQRRGEIQMIRGGWNSGKELTTWRMIDSAVESNGLFI